MRTSLLVASVVMGLVVPAYGQSEADKAQTRSYLTSLQTADGSFLAEAAATAPTLRATIPGFRAIKYWGGTASKTADAAKFVLRCRDASTGGFGDMPGQKPTVALTAMGILAAVDLQVRPEEYRDAAIQYLSDRAQEVEDIRLCAAAFESLKRPAPKAKAWLDAVAKTTNKDGTFGDGPGQVRATGSLAALTLRLNGELANRQAVVSVLKNGQRPDGGYGKAESPKQSDLDTSYRVVRSLMMLNEKPADVAKFRAFIATCRNKDGGYGVSVGQPSSISATYNAGILLHWVADARP